MAQMTLCPPVFAQTRAWSRTTERMGSLRQCECGAKHRAWISFHWCLGRCAVCMLWPPSHISAVPTCSWGQRAGETASAEDAPRPLGREPHDYTVADKTPAERAANVVLVAHIALLGPIVLAALLLFALSLLVELAMVGILRARIAETLAALVNGAPLAVLVARNFDGPLPSPLSLWLPSSPLMLSWSSRSPSRPLVLALSSATARSLSRVRRPCLRRSLHRPRRSCRRRLLLARVDRRIIDRANGKQLPTQRHDELPRRCGRDLPPQLVRGVDV